MNINVLFHDSTSVSFDNVKGYTLNGSTLVLQKDEQRIVIPRLKMFTTDEVTNG